MATGTVAEVVKLCGKLGIIGFGGPASHIAMLHIGYQRAGWPGLIAAGISFVLPAVLLSTLIAWIYVKFGALPAVQPFLAGVKPAVLAVILGALWRLGLTASKPREAVQTRIALAVIGIAVAVDLVADRRRPAGNARPARHLRLGPWWWRRRASGTAGTAR